MNDTCLLIFPTLDEVQNRQGEAYDPATSLQWYRFATSCTVSDEELFEGLNLFYDELAKNGIS